MLITSQTFKIEAGVTSSGKNLVNQPYVKVEFTLQGVEQFDSDEEFGRGRRSFQVDRVVLRTSLYGRGDEAENRIEALISGPNLLKSGSLGMQRGGKRGSGDDIESLIPDADLRAILLQEFNATRTRLAQAVMLDLQARLVFEGAV